MGLFTACLLFLFLVLPPGQLSAVTMRHLERRSEADEDGGRLILVQAVFRCGEPHAAMRVQQPSHACIRREEPHCASVQWADGNNENMFWVCSGEVRPLSMQSQSSMHERSLLSCLRDVTVRLR